MSEYYAREREERYRTDPKTLEIALELERKENEFLKSKGIKPGPSIIPKSLHPKSSPHARDRA